MYKRLIPVFLMLTVVSLACSLFTPSTTVGKTNPQSPTLASALTPAPNTPSTPAPASDQGITAAAPSGSPVLVSWEPISGATHYLIEMQAGDTFIPIAVLPASQTSYQDMNLAPATQFTYRVSSLVNGERQNSREVSVVTPPETGSPLQVGLTFDQSAPLLNFDPNTFDPNTFDPNSIDPNLMDPNTFDPNNFDPAMLMPQPIEAQAEIGPQGGEVSVKSSSGVVYRLVVPPDALKMVVTIKLTPISAVTNLPLSGGLMGAVFISPETLVFDVPAQLEITPPAEMAAPSAPLVLAFSFESEGKDFHLYPLAKAAAQSSASRPEMASLQFAPNLFPPLSEMAKLQFAGGYGEGSGTVEDVKTVTKNPPAKAQHRKAQHLATNQIDEMTPLPKIPDDLTPLPKILEDLEPLSSIEGMKLAKMAIPILQKAINANDWAKFMEAMEDFSTYLNSGGDQHNQALNDLIYDMLATKAQALLQKNKGDCLTIEDFAAQDLVERLMNPKGPFSLQFSNHYIKKFGIKLLEEITYGIKSCQFELSLKSKVSLSAEGGTLTTTADAPVIKLIPVFAQGEMYLFGSGKMQLDGKMTSKCTFPFKHYDNLTFVVQKLSPVYDKGVLSDFHLSSYFVSGWIKPVGIQSKENKDCVTFVKLTGGGDFWTGVFTIARIQDPISGWKITNRASNGSLITADWKVNSPNVPAMGVTGVTITENTLFQLKITRNKK